MSKQQKKLCSWTRLLSGVQSSEESAALINLSKHVNSSRLFRQQTESSLNGRVMNPGGWPGVCCGAQLTQKGGKQKTKQSTALEGLLFRHPECVFWHKRQHQRSVCPIGFRQLYKQVPASHFLTRCWSLFYLLTLFLCCPACQENFDHFPNNQQFLRNIQTSFIIKKKKKITCSQFKKFNQQKRV